MSAIELGRREAHVRSLRLDLRRLTPGWGDDELRVEPAQRNAAVVLRDAQDRALATFRNDTDAYFFARATSVIEELLETLEEAHAELREAQSISRSYAVLTNHLLMAKGAGFTSKEGQKRVRDAHAEALDPTPNKAWDW